jgi:DNA-directed RNA polymerase subunit RPC12/RpoP
MDRARRGSRREFDRQHYEQLIRSGIAAVKGGDRAQASALLQKAVDIDPTDARPWLWLSATTDSLDEQRDYLEHAVAAEPGNTAARRGLVVLAKKMRGTPILEIGEEVAKHPPQAQEDARVAKTYLCPQCGGHIRFDAESRHLQCDNCGYRQEIVERRASEVTEQLLDFVLPTSSGHRWADAQQRLYCERCGAIALVAAGESVIACAYCGSNQLLETQAAEELIDPGLIGLVKITEEEASRRLIGWLGKGFFIPDDLKKKVQSSTLRLAYYPFWEFGGTSEVRWMCEVNVGSGRAPKWVDRDGYEFENFDGVLVPGVKALPAKLVESIYPFQMEDLVEFQPEYLAGWLAMAYDSSLADASLKAREIVSNRVRSEINQRVQLGQEKRNLRTGSISWSGMTFKSLLLPIWVGDFVYKNKQYRVLINGQTGKIGGVKPIDRFKVYTVLIGAILGLIAVGLLLILLGLIFGLITL